MNTTRVLGCFVLAISVSTAFADEPTSMAEVKTLVIRDDAPTAKTAICISFLQDRLVASGFTIIDGGSADAEMTVTLSVEDGHDGYAVDYLIKIASLPSHRGLFSFKGHQNNSLASACKWMASRTLDKIAEAKKQPDAPKGAK